MTRKPPAILPLTSATVTVNGSRYGRRDIIWAGFRWAEGIVNGGQQHAEDHVLSVPWCHPIDNVPSGDCGWYRVRPRDERYRFDRAANGLFVLRLQP